MWTLPPLLKKKVTEAQRSWVVGDLTASNWWSQNLNPVPRIEIWINKYFKIFIFIYIYMLHSEKVGEFIYFGGKWLNTRLLLTANLLFTREKEWCLLHCGCSIVLFLSRGGRIVTIYRLQGLERTWDYLEGAVTPSKLRGWFFLKNGSWGRTSSSHMLCDLGQITSPPWDGFFICKMGITCLW